MRIFFLFINFSAAPQSSADSDIATAFQRRFHISVDESEQNNVSCAIKFLLLLINMRKTWQKLRNDLEGTFCM